MDYLYKNMSLNDIDEYSGELFLSLVRHHLYVRKNNLWNIPEDLFRNYVLPCRVNNENLEFYSKIFYDALEERVKGLSMYDAVIEVNYWCLENASYQSTNGRTASPLTVIKNAFGRCGEESTLTVSALRSVGIPARQCYAPRWSHCDDNHAWVEVWVDGKWHYIGACEPELHLDRGWFEFSASRAMLIRTRIFSGDKVENAINRQHFQEINVLDHYAKTKTLTVKVKDKFSNPIEGAEVCFQVINYSELYPIMKLKTESDGRVQFKTGLGDILVHVSKDNIYTSQRVNVNENDSIEIILTMKDEIDESFILTPPIGEPKIHDELSPQESALQEEKKESALAKKKQWEQTFLNNEAKGEFKDILIGSRGNYNTILKFIEYSKEKSIEELALLLLEQLEQKDLTDAEFEMLVEHLEYGKVYSEKYPKEVFKEGILSPRIGNEFLRPYRKLILKSFSAEEQKRIRECPEELIKWKESRILIRDTDEYSEMITSPACVMKNKSADIKSAKIWMVAVLRTLGIPAKINRADGAIWYYKNGEFTPLLEKGERSYGTVKLECDETLEYGKNFTIAKYIGGNYQSLNYNDLQIKGSEEIKIQAGHYRILTTYRKLDGSCIIHSQYFDLEESEYIEVKIHVPEAESDAREVAIDYHIKGREGENLKDYLTEERNVVCWLHPGAEPTEHLLNELREQIQEFKEQNIHLIFFVPSEESIEDVTLQKLLNAYKATVISEENIDLSKFYQAFEIEDQKLPLVVSARKNIGRYAWAGYCVGIGSLLLNSMKGKE